MFSEFSPVCRLFVCAFVSFVQSRSCSGYSLELLDTADDVLDATTRKIKMLCLADLVRAASSNGRCGSGSLLFNICMAFRTDLFGDVEENEGFNSLIKLNAHKVLQHVVIR